MIRIRPLAGAVLMALMLTSGAFADRVEVITPGDRTSLRPPDAVPEKSEVSVETLPRETGGTDGFGGRSSGRSTASSGAETRQIQPGLQTMHFGGATLECRVGSGARDLIVVNQSLEPLPSGTRIKWQLKNDGTRGFFAIIGELAGGDSLVADNVLDGKAASDDICVARVI